MQKYVLIFAVVCSLFLVGCGGGNPSAPTRGTITSIVGGQPSNEIAGPIRPTVQPWTVELRGGQAGKVCSGPANNLDSQPSRYIIRVADAGPVEWEPLGFVHYSTHPGCEPTVENPSPLEVIGQTTFLAHSSGEFTVPTKGEGLSCGRVQLDVQGFDKKTRKPIPELFFVGVVFDSGKECPRPEPKVEEIPPPCVVGDVSVIRVGEDILSPTGLTVRRAVKFSGSGAVTVNWGDGSPSQTVMTGAVITHVFLRPVKNTGPDFREYVISLSGCGKTVTQFAVRVTQTQ